MHSLLNITKEIYRTYKGDSERHAARILFLVVASTLIGAFGNNVINATLPAVSLTMSILAGFTFTALFSNHVLSVTDLPSARDETDRSELERLKLLGVNFRVRSRYFLVLATITLLLAVLLSIDMVYHPSVHEGFRALFVSHYNDVRAAYIVISITISAIARSATFFIFFECLYTFYRLSETILKIVDVRRAYTEARLED